MPQDGRKRTGGGETLERWHAAGLSNATPTGIVPATATRLPPKPLRVIPEGSSMAAWERGV
jgi:hypothetical protein